MSSEARGLLTALQFFPPRGLVGEQSNAYRILLRYDRKSRHRRIKKQRRYERLAATSQFLYTVKAGSQHPPFSRDTRRTPFRERVARTLSAARAPTPYRALNRSACKSQLGCGLSLELRLLLCPRALPYGLVLSLSGVPRIQVCCRRLFAFPTRSDS